MISRENKIIPDITLQSTNGENVRLSELTGKQVLYIHPMIGRPEKTIPKEWNSIPGASGCTAQSCGYRDLYTEYLYRNIKLYGLSTQLTSKQMEAKRRLHLPFDLLSDPELYFGRALGLPTFRVGNVNYYKRLTMIVENAQIVKILFPVESPQDNAKEILDWIDSSV